MILFSEGGAPFGPSGAFTPVGGDVGRRLVALLGAVLLACGVVTPSGGPAAAATATWPRVPGATLAAVLADPAWGSGTWEQCLRQAVATGLSPKQAADVCSVLLTLDSLGISTSGLGGGTLAGLPDDEPFDAAAITKSCAGADPTASQGVGTPNGNQAGQTVPAKQWPNDMFGQYSWGKGVVAYRDEQGTGRGLSESESREAKQRAVEAAEAAIHAASDALKEWRDAQEAVKKAQQSGNATAIQDAEKKEAEAKKRFDEARKKANAATTEAQKDPNMGGNTEPTGLDAACDQVLAGARELLRECRRTGWKDVRCQKLQARMKGCPDPALILVDPDQGYTCGATLDAKAVAEVYERHCAEVVKTAPGVGPCGGAPFETSGWQVRPGQAPGQICSDPVAMVDPDSNVCIVTLEVSDFGQTDIRDLIVVALDTFGGPIVVLPGGGDPRDDPRA